jgi:DNA-binding MarR family transcriptional regulator/GNAT superfamily N-acetyltransferase
MDSAMVEQVRRFNRTVTQSVGALSDTYLARGRPLGHSRVLWEVGRDGLDVRTLRARLDLDSGYLSRILRALQADGLVTVGPSPADGRVRAVRLTAAGQTEREILDAGSDELAASLLAPLSPGQRDRLVNAMAYIERQLLAAAVRVEEYDPRHPHARHCLAEYVAEIEGRFEAGFDPARSLPAGDDDLTRPAGLLLVATLHSGPIGCGALRFEGDGIGHIKRMWISPSVRGVGLGRRMLAELEQRAAAEGLRTIRLETNRRLPEAIELYRSTGYREVPAFNDEPYAHHWFEKELR